MQLDSVGDLDIPLQTREEANTVANYSFPKIHFYRESLGHITSLAILYSGNLEKDGFVQHDDRCLDMYTYPLIQLSV